MSNSRFAKLIDLARAPDSGLRRELLNEVTELFFQSSGQRSGRETVLFDEILQLIAAEMQDNVLEELAELFADARDAPIGLIRDLAGHSFGIARPVLQRSMVLDDQTLLRVVAYQSQQHIKAIAERPVVSETVANAIVTHGDDSALDALLRNEGAVISRASMENAVDRTRRNSRLHEAFVKRRDVPLDLLNEMYFLVESRLRDQIMKRNSSVDQATLDAALAKARERVSKSVADTSAEARRAHAFILVRKGAGELDARLLVSLHREGKPLHVLYGLAELTQLEPATVADLLERRDVDGLAMVCRAANIERPLFVTLAVLTCGGDDAMNLAEEFGRMYNSVPVEAAQRAMRFLKLRKTTTAESNAA